MDSSRGFSALGGKVALVAAWLLVQEQQGQKVEPEGHAWGHLDEDSSGYSFQFLLFTIFYGLKFFFKLCYFCSCKKLRGREGTREGGNAITSRGVCLFGSQALGRALPRTCYISFI